MFSLGINCSNNIVWITCAAYNYGVEGGVGMLIVMIKGADISVGTRLIGQGGVKWGRGNLIQSLKESVW